MSDTFASGLLISGAILMHAMEIVDGWLGVIGIAFMLVGCIIGVHNFLKRKDKKAQINAESIGANPKEENEKE